MKILLILTLIFSLSLYTQTEIEKGEKLDSESFTKDNLNTATYYNNLGNTSYYKGENNKAIEFYEKSLVKMLNFLNTMNYLEIVNNSIQMILERLTRDRMNR